MTLTGPINALSQPTETTQTYYKDSTYEVISKVAYLLGVPQNIFEHEYEPPKMEYYRQFAVNKNARIVRNLSCLRMAIMRNFKAINDKMRMEYKTLFSMPELVPMECIMELSADGISVFKNVNKKLSQHIIEINRTLSDRINNCKSLFPMWINWDYLREIFIMPDGLTEEGTKNASKLYYENRSCYPYQIYLNWSPKDEGNILYNDKKFVTLLYQWHEDVFREMDKVSDAANFTKGNIYEFINESGKTVLLVDCENSDPYRLCAAIRNLDQEVMGKITKIILFDDVHTTMAWRVLEGFISIPVEYILIERIKQNKSLVDMKLAVEACREHFQEKVDSFIIVSSDSDYWGLISSLEEARFLVMLEYEKCGPDMKAALEESGIFYCYLNDFYTGNVEDLKRSVLHKEIHRYMDHSIMLNVNGMLEDVLRTARVTMSDTEKRQFLDKYIRPMQLKIDDDGNVSIELKVK